MSIRHGDKPKKQLRKDKQNLPIRAKYIRYRNNLKLVIQNAGMYFIPAFWITIFKSKLPNTEIGNLNLTYGIIAKATDEWDKIMHNGSKITDKQESKIQNTFG